MNSDDLVRAMLAKGFLSPDEFAARPSLPAPVETAGRPFGRYQILRPVGEGGSSHVYLALDPLLGRRVALKVLKSILPEDAARFAREASLAADLRHPNIVPVYEVGQVGAELYLAMPYIEGRPLEPAGLERDLGLLLKVSRALGTAHARGMIHRDVKPWNVLVDAAGEPHLTDFGMARRLDATDGPLTRTGTLVGTPSFMSPEQARGEVRTLTAASDVFSLGATLYYLATRRLPFQGETMLEVIRKVIETDPVPAGKLNPRIASGLEAILRKAMAKAPANRYPTADAFADDLERFLRSRPVLAARRRRIALAVVPAAAVLALALLAWPGTTPPAPEAPRPPAAVAPNPRPLPPQPPPPRRPDPAPEPEPPVLDPELRARVRRGVLERPAAYVRFFLTEAERRRARRLVEVERGSDEDRAFLDRLDVEVASALEREERHLAAEAAGREPDEEFQGRLQDADLEELAEECRVRGLDREREYVLYRILAADPGNVAVRRELRLPPNGPLAGVVAAPAPPKEIPYDGRRYTADALRRELRDRGFVLLDGGWCAARDWSWAGSARTVKVGGRDVAVQTWDEANVEAAFDLNQMKVVKVTRWESKFHFLGVTLPKSPGRVSAVAVLEIEAPRPILECRIRAVSSTRDGRGAVEVSVAVNGRAPVAGDFSSAKDVGEALRGARTFSILARIETDVAADADGRLRPFAFFLPTDAKNPEPLRIEGKVAEPRPDLDQLFP